MTAALGIVGLAGALVGSFLNVVIHRLPLRESVVTGRSRCPDCRAPVAARDNVPLLSWLWLRARCRHCHAAISARYPFVELLTAVAFAAVVAVRGLDAELLLWLPFTAMLIAVAVIDLDHRIVPNRIVAPAAAWGVVAIVVVRPGRLSEALIAAAAAFAFLLVAALVRPGGMGMGDVKLAGVMGLYLGVAVAPALLVALIAGSAVGLAMVARRGAAERKTGVPFAPFLAAGGLVAVLAGPELVHLYLTLFVA